MRRLLAAPAIAAALIVGCATPAQAAGSVAHHCNVKADVTIHKQTRGGVFVSTLRCGQGTSNVHRLTVWTRPYYIKVPGRAKMLCRQAGEWFYPYNSGGSQAAVIYPTQRCS